MMMNQKKGRFLFFSLIVLLTLVIVNGSTEQTRMTRDFTQFLADYHGKVIPLSKDANIAYFEASISGSDSLYQRAEELQVKLAKIFANKEDFARLKRIKESGAITDSLLLRQLEIIYNEYMGKQLDEEMLKQIIAMQTDIEKRFSTYRSEIDGKKYSDNDIEEILQTSRDSRVLRQAWEASKKVGQEVAPDVRKLVDLRNEAARQLGFDNYHTLQLTLSEQDPRQIEVLFDELDQLTRDAFMEVKSEVDRILAQQYKISPKEMKPWHYQNRFFQEAPKIYQVDLDHFYKNQDIVEITRGYFTGLGLPIDDLIEKSDLYEKEGKYQHAYCTDIDREGDVRVVCNIKPNYQWMNTILHEYGHAVYNKFMDMNVPWTLRTPAHTFTTEAIAILLGGMAANPVWIKDVLGIPPAEIAKMADDCRKSFRLETLVFSRWSQVMYRFEKSMYSDPEQDLNKLWWDLVEKYQMIQRPEGRDEPDWASKIHVALYPAYYHNYLMGTILASQLTYTIGHKVLQVEDPVAQSYFNQPAVGQYLIESVFQPGAQYYWNDMIEKATGEKLTAKYYAMQYVH